jgi:hypothetical protein
LSGSSLLDKYRTPLDRLLRVTEETPAGEPYQAFEISTEPVRRINLVPAADASRLISYGQMVDILHSTGIIRFIFHHSTVDIEGDNLQQLILMLQEDRVKTITEFVPKFHQEQPEDAPVITKMIVTDTLTKNPEHLVNPSQ